MIERVLAPNRGPMTGTGTNTYLVSQDGGGDLAVIDPGPDEPAHVQAILERAAELGRITAVLVTHRHGDHLPAARPVCERTGAHLFGHPELPGVQRPVADDETCFGSLRALHTPGHTQDSVCFFDPDSGDLFAGDLVAGAGTVVVDDHPTALRDYVLSLERLVSLQPRTIWPGHGPRVDDALGKLHEYLTHRRQREQQIVTLLDQRGPCTVDELVAGIYVDITPSLVPMAARNVLAHLRKLRSERRTADDGERWTLSH